MKILKVLIVLGVTWGILGIVVKFFEAEMAADKHAAMVQMNHEQAARQAGFPNAAAHARALADEGCLVFYGHVCRDEREASAAHWRMAFNKVMNESVKKGNAR